MMSEESLMRQTFKSPVKGSRSPVLSALKALALTLSLSLASTGLFSSQASALPLIDTGFKVGTGVGVGGPDGLESSAFSFGGVARMKIAVLQVETSLMYQRLNYESDLGSFGKSSSTLNIIDIPVIGRFSVLPLVLFDLSVGAGIGYRYNLDAEGEAESSTQYIPISVYGEFKVPFVASAGLEARFNYSLEDVDEPIHEAMLFGQLFF
jgi:hypothetical protein